MNSKVRSIDAVNEWESEKTGVLYYFKMTMENGDVVSLGKKKKDAFKVGDSIDYVDVAPDEYGVKKTKEIQEQRAQGGGGGSGGYARDYAKEALTMCLSYAKDLVIAGKIEEGQMISAATRFHNWVKENL